MKVGDLVRNEWGEVGIIMGQIGVVDRWFIHWHSGDSYGVWGYQLEVINE